ncbi:hypothetical protein OSB04_008566 [Centaurea solstitialis]|uniref:DUF4378 domain-containing protein n=1 Tax=Centaurea solstitialis TaxID=347529 RepID=A0AA38WTY4_9ASTR|nr:hypothetical protein OSB04_008566 [Centaurea solstitialis]
MLKFKNSDFLMARRSKQRLSRQNKDRAGCMSSLVSIFDFRHGRITRRMLSDHATHLTESTTGPSYPTSEVNSITDSEAMDLRIESQNGEKGEKVRTRVKELMEEEMFGDLEFDGHLHNHEQTGKTSSRSFDGCEISNDRQVPPRKTVPQYHDLKDLMNELLSIHQKRNEEQKPASIERSNSLEKERNDPKSDEPVIHKPRNLFRRRRSKSHECISLNFNDSPLPSNKTNGFHSERIVSQFSFTEIKRKLKNAIARSPRDSRSRESPVVVVDGSSRWSSPNTDHFFSERFTRISDEFKTQDELPRLRKSKPTENDEFGDTSYRISNIYIEAKKHLSEILNNGDEEDTEFTEERHSRTLGRLLSFPEYNSPRGNSRTVNRSQPFRVENDRQEPEVLDEVLHTEGAVEIVKPLSPIETEVVDVVDLTEDDELLCSPTASLSGSSLAVDRKTEEVENTADDKTGKPSPVSVLEPMFSDGDISPARTISRFAEASLQPLRIRFEEAVNTPKNQETRIQIRVENNESAFEYVETVLLASDLNWADFEKRWLSSTEILDPSLYDELQIFSSRPAHDQRLLFNSTNEILTEVCDRSLGYFPDLPFVKPNIHPLPKGMDLINEVWERIESRIDGPYPRSLDQLIKRDLEVSKTWMDLRWEGREIVIGIEESIFEDLIDDTLSSLMHD